MVVTSGSQALKKAEVIEILYNSKQIQNPT